MGKSKDQNFLFQLTTDNRQLTTDLKCYPSLASSTAVAKMPLVSDLIMTIILLDC